MKAKIGKIVVHPASMSLMNLAIIVLTYSALKITWFGGENTIHHVHEAAELWEGIGTIVLGFGVALEERESIKNLFKFKEVSLGVDHLCHDYGVIFVVLGVMMEIFAWLVKIPNEVLDTAGVEFTLMQFAAVTALISFVLQFRYQYKLIKLSFSKTSKL